MEALIRFLQNNPIIILVMFIITLFGGLMSIIFGYKRFYDDFLSKSITLPVYAYIIILFVVALAIIFWPAIKNRPKGLQTIKGESFGVQRIFVDGKHFVNCNFRNTELAYRGEGSCRINNCSFENIRFAFDGPAAATMNTLKGLYAAPEFRPLIENTFQAIREGNLPIAAPQSGAADN